MPVRNQNEKGRFRNEPVYGCSGGDYGVDDENGGDDDGEDEYDISDDDDDDDGVYGGGEDDGSGSASWIETSVLLGYVGDGDGDGDGKGEDEGKNGDDAGSYLGGWPTWLSTTTESPTSSPPSAHLARCSACGDLMPLLLQLNANLPDRFPGHERRLYVFACRRKTCRRKEGCVGVVRGVRVDFDENGVDRTANGGSGGVDGDGDSFEAKREEVSSTAKQARLGDAIFGAPIGGGGGGGGSDGNVKGATFGNPFSAMNVTAPVGRNPFAMSGLAAAATESNVTAAAAAASSSSLPDSRSNIELKAPAADANKPQMVDTADLPQRFTSAVQINDDPALKSTSTSTSTAAAAASSILSTTPTNANAAQQQQQPHEPWPPHSALPPSYPKYPLEADYETLDKTPTNKHPLSSLSPSSSSAIPLPSKDAMQTDTATAATDEKQIFESSLDRTFQRFADRLAQNPEQVLRYEFGGDPLLYAGADDEVGRLFLAVKTNVSAMKGAGIGMAGMTTGSAGTATTTTTKTTTTTTTTTKKKTAGSRDRDVRDGRAGDGSNVASGIPSCPNCNGPRVFEVQLTPYAIEKLEGGGDADGNTGGGAGAGAGREGNCGAPTRTLDGMDWGTIIIGVCQADCRPAGVGVGQVGYLREWAGVQWEELEVEGSAAK